MKRIAGIAVAVCMAVLAVTPVADASTPAGDGGICHLRLLMFPVC